MLSVDSGSAVRYYTDATNEARSSYYTGAVGEGEPPGRWSGAGAAQLGLTGQVRAREMIGVYERFLDPRDARFADASQWDAMAEDGRVLGHDGYNFRTEEQVYQALLAAEFDPDAARRDELWVEAGRRARKNTSYHDVTFSVQKSITVLHAAFEHEEVTARRAGDEESAQAWATLRTTVENAVWAGNNAMLAYLTERAGYSRVGHHSGPKGGGSGRWIDAHDWVVASFFQHDSRSKDPQLHIHNPILNRVVCADGKVRTLDGDAIRTMRPAAAAVAERTTEEYLAAALGVRAVMRPDGKARELIGVDPQVCELLSSRRRVIGQRAAELVAAFEERHNRAATPLERDRLARRANLTTRKAKSAVESVADRLDRVEAQVAGELGTGLGAVAEAALIAARGERPAAQRWSPEEVIEVALAAVSEKHSAWRPAQLTQEINNALPDHLGLPAGESLIRLLDDLTERGLARAVRLDAAKPGDTAHAEQFRLANGTSAFVAPGAALYCTPEHLRTEHALIEATAARDGRATSHQAARAFRERLAGEGIELGADQAEVITGVLTSRAQVESLIGPAGAGKSFVLGALARAWADPDTWPEAQLAAAEDGRVVCAGRVIGLATSEKAAGVLNAEGLTAANTARWLAAQQRLAEGRALPADRELALGPDDLVVVDESSMADTAAVAAVHARVAAAGASMLMVGDHRQAGAVGAGGMGAVLAERGRAYELTEVRRFDQAWERTASLRLRAGDASVLDDYHREGRILDGGTLEEAEAAAARGFLADHLAGRQSVLVVDTNEQAARVNAEIRGRLVELGRVSEHGAYLAREGTTAGVGDVVQARRLAWELAGVEGNRRGPVNREQYLVLETRQDGSLVVAPLDTLDHTRRDPAAEQPAADQVAAEGGRGGWFAERLVLPASYVEADLTLGYAATVHAVEGLTVDTGHEVVTGHTPAHLLYPGATRGRQANHLYVVTRSARDDAAPGEVAAALTRNPRSVLAEILETDKTQRAAVVVADDSTAEAVSARVAAARLGAVAEVVVAERTTQWLDELTATGELSVAARRRLAAEDGVATLAPMLRRLEVAGHDPRAALAEAVAGRPLEDAQQVARVLAHRLGFDPAGKERGLEPAGDSFAAWAPATDDPGLGKQLAEIAAAGDARRVQLGAQLADEAPGWAIEVFGPLPDPAADPDGHAAWVRRAGAVAAHREVMGLDDPPTATFATGAGHAQVFGELLGPAPKPRQVEAYASWRAAWKASGQPDIDRDERSMSDGRLRMRVRAWEREKAWAPRRVDNELAGTQQALQHHRQTAQLRDAEAQTAADPAERERLTREAREAGALADALDAQLPELRRLREVYGTWRAHTAETRTGAYRARDELAARGAPTHEDDLITAAEHLAADRAARAEDDAHREITEHDLTDHDPTHDTDRAGDTDRDGPTGQDGRAERNGPGRSREEVERAKELLTPRDLLDLRELAAEEPAQRDEDTVRVPTAAERVDAVRRAERAVTEMRGRQAADAAREAADEQATQASRVHHWRTHDQHADTGADHDDDARV